MDKKNAWLMLFLSLGKIALILLLIISFPFWIVASAAGLKLGK